FRRHIFLRAWFGRSFRQWLWGRACRRSWSSGRKLNLTVRRRRHRSIFFRRSGLSRRRRFFRCRRINCGARILVGAQPGDLLGALDFRCARPAQERNQSRNMNERDQDNVSPETCVAAHFYFASALVAIPTFVIWARCNESISVTNFCTGSSRSGRMTMATSGFVRFSSSNRAVKDSASTISSLILIVSARSIEIVWTCVLVTGGLAALLEGMTRFMLFSSSGVVIMKIIRSTKARSSNGVTLISLRVEKLLRLE